MANIKVLIVDDESVGRQLLQAILMMEGYETFLAENGLDAIEKTKQIHPDIILLDIMMPNMSGYEVTKRIREDIEIKDTPIILVSALDDRDSKSQGINVGANFYISKPFDQSELLKLINSIISSD